MCNRQNREAAMVVLDPGTPERKFRDGVWCDPCLAPLVKALNDGGLRTVASCCGHGSHLGNIALADGRILAIHPDRETWAARDNRTPARLLDWWDQRKDRRQARRRRRILNDLTREESARAPHGDGFVETR
jgi:hypothetical protein